MSVRSLIRHAAQIVVPITCGGCGLPGADLCEACCASLRWCRQPTCQGCGQVVATTDTVHRCGDCRGRPPLFARHAAAYEGALARAIGELKDHGRLRLARALALLVIEADPAPCVGTLVPVPLDRQRQRARGFNQAALIATALGEQWGLPVANLLERTKRSPPQRGAARSARIRQVAGAFGSTGDLGAAGPLIVVDDVHTTGATLGSCARALRSSGATDVTAVTVSRVWPRYIRGDA